MNSGARKSYQWQICLALLLATGITYVRAFSCGFINYDDPDYVTENPMVRAGLTWKGVVWAFTHFYASNWHPLTWISHMLDCQLFGLNATGPHIVNVLLHAANAICLFLLLDRLTARQWRSAIVAALFALHPLHVESVAWISERKDVLSTLFGLLSLIAYTRYAKGLSVPGGKPALAYACALVFFILSLLAKPMLVTLPFLMLLLDMWPLQRWGIPAWRALFTPQFARLVLEKLPWFALSLASSVATYFAQKTGGSVLSTEHFPFFARLANAATSYFGYLVKAVWPIQLAVFYPLPAHPSSGLFVVTLLLLLGISLACALVAFRWPFLLIGWLWFLGTLVPVIGLIQVGGQSMADRYTYFPLTGIFIAVVWGLSEIATARKIPALIPAILAALVLGLAAVGTNFQLQFWQSSMALFSHTLAVTRENAPAENNLGVALASLGRKQDALAHYAAAVRISPQNPRFQNNFATALVRAGQPADAVEHYRAAIAADPGFAEAYSNLGALLFSAHQWNDAVTNLSEAVRLLPQNPEVRGNFANALAAAGHLDEALAQYSAAIHLNASDAGLHLNAGLALLKANRPSDAAAQFAAATALNPAGAEARYQYGRLLFANGQFTNALEQFTAAVQAKPGYAAAQFYEAAALGELGRFDDAIAAGTRALDAALQSGQTNAVAHINEALESFRARQPYRPGKNSN